VKNIRFLYTNIKQWVSDNATFFFIRGRTRGGKRVTACAINYSPHFYVKDSDYNRYKQDLENSIHTSKIYKDLKVTKSIYGDPVMRVDTYIPKGVRNTHSKEGTDALCDTILDRCETFQSDIPVEIVFLIEAGIKSGVELPDTPDTHVNGIPAWDWHKFKAFDDFETKIVVSSLDIETYHFRGKNPKMEDAEQEVVAVAMHNFAEKIKYQIFYRPGHSVNKDAIKRMVNDPVDNNMKHEVWTYFVDTEKKLFKKFVEIFNFLDADVYTAWNSNYDFGYILNRAKKIKFAMKGLCPFSAFMRYSTRAGIESPSITSVTLMDSIQVYYKHTFFDGEKHSYNLEAVAQGECGCGKIPKINPETGRKVTTGQMCDEFPDLLLDYNEVDDLLVEAIANVKNLWGYREHVRRRLGVPIDRSMSNSIALHVEFVRRANAKGMAFPNRNFDTMAEETFKAAVVFPPTPGVTDSAIDADFKSLYASIIVMWNISLETVLRDPTKYPKAYLDKCIRTPNGLFIKQPTEQKGLIAEIVEGFMKDRDAYKQEALEYSEKYGRKDARTAGKEMAQKAEKANTNSVYGIMPLYNILIAEAIAAIGKEAVTHASNTLESPGLLAAMQEKFPVIK
jgi:DNA polymerase elongation subunit (family B)